MKRFNLLLLLQLMAVAAFGQISLTGLVKGDGDTLAGASVMPKRKSDRLTFSFKDLNRDGLLDLMLHFAIKDLVELSVGDKIAVLEGNTFEGTPIMGSDTVKIVK